MALKGDRQIDSVEVRYFINETTDPGVIVSISTAGSGIGMDNTANLVTVAGNSSGNKPLGLLLTKVVNVDETRFPTNWHKDEVNVGDKVCILTKGWVVTDKITGTIAAGQFAVLSSSGTVAGLNPGGTWNEAANPKVGRFRTGKNEAGFASVYIDL